MTNIKQITENSSVRTLYESIIKNYSGIIKKKGTTVDKERHYIIVESEELLAAACHTFNAESEFGRISFLMEGYIDKYPLIMLILNNDTS